MLNGYQQYNSSTGKWGTLPGSEGGSSNNMDSRYAAGPNVIIPKNLDNYLALTTQNLPSNTYVVKITIPSTSVGPSGNWKISANRVNFPDLQRTPGGVDYSRFTYFRFYEGTNSGGNILRYGAYEVIGR